VRRRKPSQTLPEMERRARRVLQKDNKFLLGYDIKGSRGLDEEGMMIRFAAQESFHREVNKRLSSCVVSGDIGGQYLSRIIEGMDSALSDSGVVFLNNPDAIAQILDIAKEIMPTFKIRWAVGKEKDEDVMELVK